MDIGYPDEILLSVRKPSRYLGKEPYFPLKDWERATLRTVLCYPDLYEVGRSHLGITILAGLINSKEDWLCDLVFSVAPDMEFQLKLRKFPLLSLNYLKPIRSFDVLGITYAYELLVTNILQILDLSKIPFEADERDESYPIVIGGGPCVGNPEPIAELFDAIVIGDGEAIICDLLKKIEEWKKEKTSKEVLWQELKNLPGVYVPPLKNKVKKVFYLNLNNNYKNYLYSIPVIPLSHDRLSLEISRGCTRSCRFCEAGIYYRPVRERSPEDILKQAELGFQLTGYRSASLMSLSAGDYSALEELIDLLERRFYNSPQREYVFSLPSLRVGSLSPKVLSFLKKGRTSTLTIAIEAGSERLRRVINKNIDLDALYRDLTLAQNAGFQKIKLYFMLGLPTEEERDLEELVSLYKDLKRTFRKLDITVSASIFVPKPHTPFQWERQISLEEAQDKIQYLRDKLRGAFKHHDPKQSFLEGVISRGGRELLDLIFLSYERGARLDSWSDYFQFHIWLESSESSGIDFLRYLRKREHNEPLPWDHIDLGISEAYLLKELQRAIETQFTEDCRFSRCNQCGVCGGPVKNVIVREIEKRGAPQALSSEIPSIEENSRVSDQQEYWYVLRYNKTGPAKYLSQLEVLRLFELLLRRLEVRLSYTQGFNPRPKFVTDPASPVGVEVWGGYLYLATRTPLEPENFQHLSLYEGIDIVKAHFLGQKKPSIQFSDSVYYIKIKHKSTDLSKFMRNFSSVKELQTTKDDDNSFFYLADGDKSILKILKEITGIGEPLKYFSIIKIYIDMINNDSAKINIIRRSDMGFTKKT